MKNFLIGLTITILKKWNIHKHRRLRNMFYSVDYVLGVMKNTSKGYQQRHETAYKCAEEFVRYFFTTSHLERKISILKNNLDTVSKKTIDQTIERYRYLYTHNAIRLDDISNTPEELKEYEKVEDYLAKIEGKYIFPKNFSLNSQTVVFYYKNGLMYLPKHVINGLNGKDFIDAGAFIGDSSLIFAKDFKPKNVWAFEPSETNFQILKQTIVQNKLQNVIPIKMGIGDKNTVSRMVYFEAGSYVDEKGQEKVELTTIDTFVNENALDVGLIKMDIEGYEFKAMTKAKNTIVKYKPVLLISIYHTGIDFFEIKPLIEKWVPGYAFTVRKLNPLHPTYEVMLIGYYRGKAKDIVS